MRRLLAWVQGFAESLGGPGLFVIAYLDSSFLSFPQVCDALIVLLTVRHPERMVFYALTTTHRIGGGLLLAVPRRPEGRRGVPAEAFSRAPRRPRPGRVPPSRHPVDSGPVADAAADAVQDLRARRGRVGDEDVRLSRRRSRSGEPRATSASDCWRCGRGSRRWRGFRRTRARQAWRSRSPSCSARLPTSGGRAGSAVGPP